ncbi:hypothetical protein CYMTET_16595 [Cymbomonas tetramitiformis]|uniref:CSD domain-containing protein n=1 Tax=Cymbomonas tetramitiformis TaxID=36881 RepID=A0AAE0L7Z6_9CHLO|nr:hypothetical protein CYMTET_16595 [Cymbomonas tetramitiformis]
MAATGTVKWFNSEKGFGFITPSDGSADLFVHQSSIHAEGFRSLAENEEVEFKVIEENGRTKAVEVTGPAGGFVQGAPREYRGYKGGGGGGGGRGGGGAPKGGRGGGKGGEGCFKCGASDHWAPVRVPEMALLELVLDAAEELRQEAALAALLTLRNLSFAGESKAYFTSSRRAFPLIIRFLEMPCRTLRAYASSTLWALLHNGAKVKAALRSSDLLHRIFKSKREVCCDWDAMGSAFSTMREKREVKLVQETARNLSMVAELLETDEVEGAMGNDVRKKGG